MSFSHGEFANCVNIECPVCGHEHPVPVSTVENCENDSPALLCDRCWELGDFDSAMTSAGWGTDEDYGDYGCFDDF